MASSSRDGVQPWDPGRSSVSSSLKARRRTYSSSDDSSEDEPEDEDPYLKPIPDEDPYWKAPKVVALLEKLREAGQYARGKATTRRDKRMLEKFYSDAGLRRRVQLMSHPAVMHALNTIWTAADTDQSHFIEKNEYLVMHRKLVLALDPSTSPKHAFAAAEEDWIKDSEGKPGLDRDRFFWCWFELADLWTDSMASEDYVNFLRATMETITRIGQDGPEWASDREVIKAHFKRRAEGSADIEDDGNHHPYILSLWHSEIKKDNIAHAAARLAREARRKRFTFGRPSKPESENMNTLVQQMTAEVEKEDEVRRERRKSILESRFNQLVAKAQQDDPNAPPSGGAFRARAQSIFFGRSGAGW